jgi:predicted esterase
MSVRWWRWGALWWTIACGGGSTDGKDVVEDSEVVGETDAMDSDSDGPVGVDVYTAVEPSYTTRSITVQGRTVIASDAPDPIGLVLLFHGSGGGSGLLDTTEMIALCNAFSARGLGFAAIESEDRASGQFDDASAPADNPDWGRLVVLRDQLIAAELADEATPVVAWGFSAGGAFASYVGHAAEEEGWPIRGVVAHSSRARSGRYGDLPDLPAVLTIGPNDEVVGFEAVEEDWQERAAAGRSDVWLPLVERDLVPTWFARVPYISAADSRQLVLRAVELGYFDGAGRRLFDTTGLQAKVDEIVAAIEARYPKPVTGQLKVLLAMHAISAQHADAEADAIAAWVR